MNPKIKVLLVNTQMEKGGAQKAMLSLASNLSRELFDVTVCTMYDKADFISSFENEYDLKINNLKMKASGLGFIKKVKSFLKGSVLLFKILKRRQIDIVQSYSHTANIIVPVIAYLAGVKIRITSQRMSLDKMSKAIQLADRFVENSFLVTKLTSVSEGTKQSCIKDQNITPDKIITIPNGIDLQKLDSKIDKTQNLAIRAELGLSPDDISIITVARLHKQKGHFYYLPAIKKVVDSHPNAKFLFVGHGELRTPIQEYLKRENLTEHVFLLGARDDVPSLLAVSDIFVLPSLWEGMPNTVLEAMGVGMPVIATAVDGTPEIITDDVEGLLISSKSENDISSALEKVLEDEPLRQKMSQASRKRIEDYFSLDQTTKMFEDLYQTLVNKN